MEDSNSDIKKLEAELGEVKDELAAAPKVCPKCPVGEAIVNKEICKCAPCNRWHHYKGLKSNCAQNIYRIDLPTSLKTAEDPYKALDVCESICEGDLECNGVEWWESGDKFIC